MIRTFAIAGLLLAGAVAFGGIAGDAVDLTADAQAGPFCGDGAPMGPCSCPHLGLPNKEPLVPLQC